jgi:hypothetical protein
MRCEGKFTNRIPPNNIMLNLEDQEGRYIHNYLYLTIKCKNHQLFDKIILNI